MSTMLLSNRVITLLATIILLIGSGCNKSDKEIEQLKSRLVGTWKIDNTRSAVYDGQGKELYNPPAMLGQPGDYWIFTEDNTAQEYYQNQLKNNGRYRVADNSVYVTIDQQVTIAYLIKSLTASNLTLELTNPGNGQNEVVHTIKLNK